MKITIAKSAGFCMGVRRAVDMVLDAANKTSDPISTFGPLIHNPQVLNMLEERGIPAINYIPKNGKGTILIRAHGVPPQEQKALFDAGFNVINATCPRVIRVQTIIRKHAKKGFATIIVGDKDHPEVKGLMGYAQTFDIGYTVSTIDELQALPKFDRAIVVAQTTQDTSLYNALKVWISEHYPHYKIFDTICDSTEKRQAEVREIAQECDAVVVVGGKDSGNTRRLAQVAAEAISHSRKRDKDNCEPFSVHIEDVSELDMSRFKSVKSIAITAGASTPNWIINRTRREIEQSLEKRDKNSFLGYLLAIRDFILRSSTLLAVGAGSLAYACSDVQGVDNHLIHALIAMFYILSMQIMNNLFSIKSDRYNNTERAEFYDSNRLSLTILAVISGGLGLLLSFTTGLLPFLILSLMSILGLLYNQKIVPTFFTKKFSLAGRKIASIKDIPGSKTILIAAAWGTVTSILPAIASSKDSLIFIIPFIFSTSIVFARTSFFAILEMQGDRITGKETIPIILGEKRSQRLIQNLLLLASGLFAICAILGLISTSAILIATIPLLMLYAIKLHEQGKIHTGTNLELIIESHFILAGIIALFL
ncbi:MAG: 4-hydroxy-3-methylbut-2-enyl diphosphate reductase [Desulfamplus sp.]|nr:4-hydroxy-3-methylbut-2-enyl diphosphate reductase [Desulfamplus sp.]